MTDITDEQADEIFRARLVGKTIRTLAKRFGLTTGEVAELVESMCQPVSPAMRRAVLMLDLERLEILGEPGANHLGMSASIGRSVFPDWRGCGR
jgi:hypothetical protein